MAPVLLAIEVLKVVVENPVDPLNWLELGHMSATEWLLVSLWFRLEPPELCQSHEFRSSIHYA